MLGVLGSGEKASESAAEGERRGVEELAVMGA